MAGLDSYTKLLLHMNGDLSDSSGNGYNAAASGTVTFSSSPAKFGQSAYVTGSGNYIAAPVNADMQFGTGAFTIDFWAYITSWDGGDSFFELNYYYAGMYFSSNETYLLPHYLNTGSYRAVPWAQSLNAWFHIAWVRDDESAVYLFHNGTLLDTWTDTANLQPTIGSDNFIIANCHHDSSRTLDGYIDEFRVSKGVARWTENFTPPTAAYGMDYRTSGLAARANLARRGFVSLSGMSDILANTKISGIAAQTAIIGQCLSGMSGRVDIARERKIGQNIKLDIAGNRIGGIVEGGRDIAAPREAAASAQAETYTLPGWEIWLDGTRAGWIDQDAGTTALNLGALADGTYEVEIRPAEFFWPAGDPGVRSARKIWFEVFAGNSQTMLPPLENLRSERVGGQTYLRWDLPNGYGAESVYDFGLWAGTASPVDTSGTAAQTSRAWDGPGAYRMLYAQESAGYVAMAARNSAGNHGLVSEIALDWSGTMTAPENIRVVEA